MLDLSNVIVDFNKLMEYVNVHYQDKYLILMELNVLLVLLIVFLANPLHNVLFVKLDLY